MRTHLAPFMFVVALLMAVSAAAQETTRVPVVVTSVAGRFVYLDQGSRAGLATGMVVTLRPPRRAAIEVTIVSVSSTSARAELPPREVLVAPGTPGDVLLPVIPTEAAGVDEEAGTEPEGAEPDRPVPDHPPWTYPELDLQDGAPLLAPVHRERPELRPTTFRGRAWAGYDYLRDRGAGRDRDFQTARVGTAFLITNPFGRGGRVAFDGEVIGLRSDLNTAFAEDTDTTRVEIDELSYAIGGEDYASYRLEIGRFFPDSLPEIGPMDGIEAALQFEHGFRLGVGAGSYLRPFLSRSSGEDMGFHLFLDYESSGEQHLSATVAYQKTWHEGTADRDLILGRLNWRPVDTLWLFSSWKIDMYTDDDVPKSSGPDLTELFVTATWTPDSRVGLSATYNHYEWVAVDQREFEDLPDEVIAEGKVDRAYASAWWRIAPDLRLSGRYGVWEDQVGDGSNGEVMLDITPSSWPVGIDGGVYFSDARYLDGTGYRGRVTLPFTAGQFFVGYDRFDFSRTTFDGTGADAVRQILRSGLDFVTGRWSHSLYADWEFGDDEDAYRLGFYTSYRF